jgi:RNA polymerase sigma-70 factor (ECF subfamily)
LPERAGQSDPSHDVANKDFFGELDKRLQALPLRQKRAFVLAEFEGLSYEEIAHIEAAPIGTIKSRINRAKKKLRSALRESYGDAL